MSKLLIFFFFFFFVLFYHTQAYDPIDSNGNITIKWDIIKWTEDGYVVSIYIKQEAYSVRGMTIEQGHCSDFKGLACQSYCVSTTQDCSLFCGATHFQHGRPIGQCQSYDINCCCCNNTILHESP